MYSRGSDPRYRGLPTHFSLPKQTAHSIHLAPTPPSRGYSMVSMTAPLHRTMTNTEARQRQQTMRNRQKNTKAFVKMGNLSSPRGNYENAFPVNIAPWTPEEGNINIQSRTDTQRAMYNIMNRSRHAALWKKEFENTAKKSRRTRRTTRKQMQKGGGKDLLEALMTSPEFKFGSHAQQDRIMRYYVEVLKAKLDSLPEFNSLLQLLLMKYGLSPDINSYNVN